VERYSIFRVYEDRSSAHFIINQRSYTIHGFGTMSSRTHSDDSDSDVDL